MSNNNVDKQQSTPEPPVAMVDRVIFLARTLPWWAILLVGGVLWVAYGVWTNEDKKDALDFLADRPSVNTDELFDVTYEINATALLVDELSLLTDLDGERFSVSYVDVLFREEGRLECPEDAQDCLPLTGLVVTYRDYNVPANVEPAGVTAFEGLVIEDSGDSLRVELPDGQILAVPINSVIEEREGQLACDRVTYPDCETLSGTIVTFERPYILAQGVEVRTDVQIRYLQDGYERTIRPVFIEERWQDTLPCDDDAPDDCLEVTATYISTPDNIIGTEVERTDEYSRVRTVEQQTVDIIRERLISMESGLVECNRDADPRCQDFQGTILEVTGEVLTGRLTFESGTNYRIVFEGSDQAERFSRQEIQSEIRDPENCQATDQDPPCMITIQLDNTTVAGRIVNETDASLLVETVPEHIVQIDLDDIVDAKRRVPGQCALNNLRGCNEGLWLTIIITFSAYGLALVIGLIVGLFRVSSNPVLYHLSTVYVEFVRGVPLIVLLVVFAFVIAPQVREAGGIVGDTFTWIFDQLNKIEVRILGYDSLLSEAVLGLAVGYGAFLAEVFRAGIQSIPKGQMEASRGLGMSYMQSMRHVILPQAVRVVLPPIGNDFIAMLKDTSLVIVLALPDLFQRGRGYASDTFQYIDVYTVVALYYICMTLFLSILVRLIERWSRLP